MTLILRLGSGNCRPQFEFSTIGGVLDHNRTRRVPLEPEDVTVAQVLKARGYATGMTGKWGLGEPGSTGEPNRKGFEEKRNVAGANWPIVDRIAGFMDGAHVPSPNWPSFPANPPMKKNAGKATAPRR